MKKKAENATIAKKREKKRDTAREREKEREKCGQS